MAVSITWSTSAGGSGISSVSHGNSANGSTTTAQRIYIRHDGLNSITGCAFYFTQKSGSYTGGFSAAADFNELLGWGDNSTEDGFGGVQINMDAEGSFSGGDTWDMSQSQKSSPDGYKFTLRTGVGDTGGNAFALSEKMSSSMSTNGEIDSGVNDASFQIRVKVPTDESTVGTRQFDQVLKFTYTS